MCASVDTHIEKKQAIVLTFEAEDDAILLNDTRTELDKSNFIFVFRDVFYSKLNKL